MNRKDKYRESVEQLIDTSHDYRKKAERLIRDHLHWESFNQDYAQDKEPNLTIEGKKQTGKTITHIFFEYFQLGDFLKLNHMLQLGASNGAFLSDFKATEKTDKVAKQVIGYDYTATSISELKRRTISSRQIDLNSIDSKTNQLSYRATLIADLAEPTNIVAVRILENLLTTPLRLLLHELIQNARLGTVFFFIQCVTIEEYDPDRPEHFDFLPFLPIDYVYSFFAPRIDMKTLKRETVCSSSRPIPRANLKFFDELMVVTKIGTPKQQQEERARLLLEMSTLESQSKTLETELKSLAEQKTTLEERYKTALEYKEQIVFPKAPDSTKPCPIIEKTQKGFDELAKNLQEGITKLHDELNAVVDKLTLLKKQSLEVDKNIIKIRNYLASLDSERDGLCTPQNLRMKK